MSSPRSRRTTPSQGEAAAPFLYGDLTFLLLDNVIEHQGYPDFFVTNS